MGIGTAPVQLAIRITNTRNAILQYIVAFVGAEISGRVAEMVPFIGKRCIEWLLKMGVS